MSRRIALFSAIVVAALAGCRGYDTIPGEEAAWQRVEPQLVGMSGAAVEHCAGMPRRESQAGGGGRTLVYRAEDHKNYCEVALLVRDGRVASVSVDHDAPEFLWLRDGSNYCGRIFARCGR